jgi:hypothetical protein
MVERDPKYWFPAKRYGWGWGLPATWQGWVFLIIWLIVIAAGARFLPPHQRPLRFALFVVAMVAVMTAVCYAKGEPPRWRWGDKDNGRR